MHIRGQAIPVVTAPRLRPVEHHDEPAVSPRVRPEGSISRRRPAGRRADQLGANPDRLALWAFGFALLLLLVAAISSHGL